LPINARVERNPRYLLCWPIGLAAAILCGCGEASFDDSSSGTNGEDLGGAGQVAAGEVATTMAGSGADVNRSGSSGNGGAAASGGTRLSILPFAF
jgi:hypothetical protein